MKNHCYFEKSILGNFIFVTHPSPSTDFMKLKFFSDKGFKGVIAKEYYTLAYTSESIYGWGLNVGQFGVADDKLIQPKKLTTFSHSIAYVDASDSSIACLTTSGTILLFAKHKIKTLKKPVFHENVRHISIRGGELSSTLLPEKPLIEPLEIFIIMDSELTFVWSGETQKYRRCEIKPSMSLHRILPRGKNLIVLSSDGNLFHGELKNIVIDRLNQSDSAEEFVEQKANRRQDFDENQCCEIHLTRIPYIDRVTDVSVDQKGDSFVILQESSKRYLTIPILPDDPISFKALLTEVDEFDQLHDIVFHVSI